MDHCETCGNEVHRLELAEDDYFRCRRCVENWESSQEDQCNADSGPLSIDEQYLAAWHASSEGR